MLCPPRLNSIASSKDLDDPKVGSPSALVIQLLSEPPDSEQDSVEESLRSGWTARNVNVDGHDVLDASQRGVIFAKDATTYAAGTNRDHDFWFWHSLVGL